jgi:hypothetical protein
VPAGAGPLTVALAALLGAAALVACSPNPAADAAQTRCGSYTIPQMRPGIPADKLGCLSSAYLDGRSATLEVTEFTTEGDPVVTTYTTTPDRKLDVVVDSTADAFGGPDAGIAHYECNGASFTLGRVDVGGCETLAGPRESPSD